MNKGFLDPSWPLGLFCELFWQMNFFDDLFRRSCTYNPIPNFLFRGIVFFKEISLDLLLNPHIYTYSLTLTILVSVPTWVMFLSKSF